MKYWPKEKILQIRFSANDYLKEGLKPVDVAKILNQFKKIIDIVHVSSGGIIPLEIDDYQGYQLPYAKLIKEVTGLTTIAGGQLSDFNLAKKSLENHETDFIFFDRMLLQNPYFIYTYNSSLLPKQYKRATQLKKG